jgi:hypothetical protein
MTDEPELDLEAPEEDAYEQRQTVLDEVDESDGPIEQGNGLSEESDQANEADLLDQRTPVPSDDEDYGT